MVTGQGPAPSQSRQGGVTAKAGRTRKETRQRSGERLEERGPQSGTPRTPDVRCRGRSRSCPAARVSRPLPESRERDHAMGAAGVGRVPEGSRGGLSSGAGKEEEERVSSRAPWGLCGSFGGGSL